MHATSTVCERLLDAMSIFNVFNSPAQTDFTKQVSGLYVYTKIHVGRSFVPGFHGRPEYSQRLQVGPLCRDQAAFLREKLSRAWYTVVVRVKMSLVLCKMKTGHKRNAELQSHACQAYPNTYRQTILPRSVRPYLVKVSMQKSSQFAGLIVLLCLSTWYTISLPG